MRVSREVEQVFCTSYLHYVWQALRSTGFDTEKIAAEFFKAYSATQNPREVSESTYFLVWGVEVLQPMMNEKLKNLIGKVEAVYKGIVGEG